MIALHWVVVVKLTLLLIIHKFFLNTHCPCRWKFSSTSVSILINDSYGRSWYISHFSNFIPDIQQFIFMKTIIFIPFHNSSFPLFFTCLCHDNISIMLPQNTFFFCNNNFRKFSIMIYFRWRRFCIFIFIGIFITNVFCNTDVFSVLNLRNIGVILLYFLVFVVFTSNGECESPFPIDVWSALFSLVSCGIYLSILMSPTA